MHSEVPFRPSHSGKYNFDRIDINAHFPRCRGVRCHEYIVTGISSAPYNESHIKLSLGYKDFTTNFGVKVLECSEYRVDEVCRAPLPYRPFQTEWVPSHPQLLSVATHDLRFYEYENRNLTLKESFLEQIFNPVMSIDWNSRKLAEMLITRRNGEVAIISLEYGTPIELIEYRQSPYRYISEPPCGARFGTGEMENCIVLIDDHNVIKIFDHRFLMLSSNVAWVDDEIFGMECSKHNDYLIATLTEREIFLHDMRYLHDEVAIFNNFGLEEHATSLCWSPHSPEIHIGTSAGAIIKWRTNGDRRAERYYNQNKKIASVHYPEANSNFFLSTCFDSPTDDYARNIETYSIR